MKHSTETRFPPGVGDALRSAGWQPGRWDIRQAEVWADTLLTVPAATGPLRGAVAPTPVVIDPLRGLHLARTLGDLGRALETEVCPLGEEVAGHAQLAIDAAGRVYAIDHTGDYYLGPTIDRALRAILTGSHSVRLTP
jgi:hypothetical protein